MKQLFTDIINVLKNFDRVDFLLYFAILFLLVLVVSLIYIIKNDETMYEEQEEDNEELDLNEVVSNIENTSPSAVDLTKYEEEQEEKAIISYDELIAKNKVGTIKYDNEEIINDEVSVKKIDLNNIIEENDKKINDKNIKSPLYKYEKEEEFLKTLKSISKLLN